MVARDTKKIKNKGVRGIQLIMFLLYSIPFIYFLKYITKHNYLIGLVIGLIFISFYLFVEKHIVYRFNEDGMTEIIDEKTIWIKIKLLSAYHIIISIILVIIIGIIELSKLLI